MFHGTAPLALFLSTTALAAPLAFAQGAEAPVQTSPEVRAADLRRQLSTLASDEMKGRSTGSPEALEAARYLASELKRMGVEPGGEDGTYFQKVPMGSTEYLQTPTLTYVGPGAAAVTAVPGVDFEISDGGCESRSLSVVYAASAAEIPKAPVAQAALVILAEKSRDRAEWLRAAGAPDGAGWGLIIGLGAKDAGLKPMEGPPRERSRVPGPTPRITVRGALRQACLDRQLSTLMFSAPIRVKPLESVNVIGKVPGVGSAGDKALASEIVEFSAHYDHLAPRTPKSNAESGQDLIFNGADDDASGCAVVLELAEAFAAGPKPARTLLFFFATGEEIGLVGSDWSLEHPLVPLEKIVVDVNFEMLGRPDPLLSSVILEDGGAEKINVIKEVRAITGLGLKEAKDLVDGAPKPVKQGVTREEAAAIKKQLEAAGAKAELVFSRMWLTGFERSDLGLALQKAGVPVVADLRPEQGFFQRSDNYAMAKRGIVAQTLSSFGLHKDYHQVSDEVSTIDFEHLEACAAGALVGCRAIADGSFRPKWREGLDPSKPQARPAGGTPGAGDGKAKAPEKKTTGG